VQILIVEDEDRIAAFVERGLKAEGFAVQVASDGDTGYALACDEGVDLVVLDLMLPGLSGEQVLERLRARRSDVPVIVLTAKSASTAATPSRSPASTSTRPPTTRRSCRSPPRRRRTTRG
jgi:DNA-binding response OmpR family regulator